MNPIRLIPVVLAVLASPAVWSAEPSGVGYPAGYRDWTHVKSLILESGHPLYESFGGIHHIYANAKAMRGYRDGRFADGSVIVFDLLEVKKEGNAIAEGPRKVLGVMQKDARRYKTTGGWGFEGFAGGDKSRRVVGDQAASACYGCHAEQAGKTGYVFSAWRE